MLGSFRFFLAICVIIFHLSGSVPTIGMFAVECFYVISGYLMTLVLNENYHFELVPFIENRFLRLYPTYYALILLTLACWVVFPSISKFHPAWDWQGRFADVFANITIFPWSLPLSPEHLSRFRVLPPTWSVAVEISCYALLWLFVARKWWTAAITLVITALVHVYTFVHGMDPTSRYFPVSASMLAFSIGSLTYRIAKRTEHLRTSDMSLPWTQAGFLLFGIALFVINWLAGVHDTTATSNPTFYLDMIIASAVAMSFHRIRVQGILGKIDRWLGDLSYPIFLSQFTAGYVTWRLLGSPDATRGWRIALGAIALSILLGVASILLIDRPIQRVRGRIRRNSQADFKSPIVSAAESRL